MSAAASVAAVGGRRALHLQLIKVQGVLLGVADGVDCWMLGAAAVVGWTCVVVDWLLVDGLQALLSMPASGKSRTASTGVSVG